MKRRWGARINPPQNLSPSRQSVSISTPILSLEFVRRNRGNWPNFPSICIIFTWSAIKLIYVKDCTVVRDDVMTITRHHIQYTSTALWFFPLEKITQGCLQSVVKNTFPCHYMRINRSSKKNSIFTGGDKKLKSRMLFFLLEKTQTFKTAYAQGHRVTNTSNFFIEAAQRKDKFYWNLIPERKKSSFTW